MLRVVFRIIAALGLTASILVWLECHRLWLPRQRGAELRNLYVRRWGRGMLRVFGFHLEFDGSQVADAGALLVVANHRSPFDVPVLCALFGGRALGQAAAEKLPIFGVAARRGGTIFVDRQSKTSGKTAIAAVRDALLLGDTVLVFPEGTTYPGDEVRAFRYGAISAAEGLKAAIVPVGLCYDPGVEFTEARLRSYLFRVASKKSLPVQARIGQAFPATTDVESMVHQAQDQVQSLVAEARERLHRRGLP